MNIALSVCTQSQEWRVAKNLRDKHFFAPSGLEDPYAWTFDHPDHLHFVLSRDAEIIGYAHVQLWPQHRAALRIIVIEETHRNQSYGTQFMRMIEEALAQRGYQRLHTESRPSSLKFYQRLGYRPMAFEDPDGHPLDPQDISLGKALI